MNSKIPTISSVQKALKDSRDSLGKETRPYHYVNEIRLIRYAMTGSSKTHIDFVSLSREESHVLRRVICLNRRLIKLHVDYKQRREACRQLALKLQSKT
jgi:hypothetical protein